MVFPIKRVISFLFVLFLGLALAGSAFLFWQSKEAVSGLNASLPEGVRVVKSVIGNTWKVINEIDGYEFKVPKEWEEIKEIKCKEEEVILDNRTTGIIVNGLTEVSTTLSLDIYFLNKIDSLLEESQKIWSFFGLDGNLEEINIGGIKAVKAYEDVHLWGTYVYFWKTGNKLYVANNGSEEFIREIILNGKW